MLTANAVLFFVVLMLVAALLEPLVEKIMIPFSIILVLIGYLGSEFAIRVLEIDTGIRWDNFQTIIFNVFLPILIFHAALKIDIKLLRANAAPIFFLAFPLMLLITLLTGIFLYYGINHPTGFPWMAALLAGAILSATDPTVLLSILKKSNISERVSILLEGESLFNDTTAIVLFMLIISIALSGVQAVSWYSTILQFCYVFFGGLGIGLIIGLIALFILKRSQNANVFGLITLLCAYSSYLLANNIFHLSGVMAVLSAGLLVGGVSRCKLNVDKLQFTNTFWSFAAYMTEMLIFLLAGITINIAMFKEQWLAMTIGIIAVLAIRFIVFIGLFSPLCRIPGIQPVHMKDQLILSWGGIRGTVTMALALSLPLSLDYWYTIQSIAYGVVVFTLFIQATSMRLLIRKLNY
jgi:CPA1 family monovalent cation:H+ antiporter